MKESDILSAVRKMEAYIIRNNYAGYDPYDFLTSPLFKLPFIRKNKSIRFISQQVFRRIPFNLRPLFGIRKGINPVTLGLAVQAYAYKRAIDFNDSISGEIEYCVAELTKLKSAGYSGTCWGYNFDWEARYAGIPAYMPTVVATSFIVNALYTNYRLWGDKECADLCVDSANFVLKDLNRHYDGDLICFSYSPRDNQKVFNASIKGARILAQAYSITGDKELLRVIEKSVQYIIKYQREDGSWHYSAGDARTWSDNYHTAYVLDGLDEIGRLTGKDYSASVSRGLRFYADNFFTDEGVPKYYNNNIYPIDTTAGAQSIITLTRFGYKEKAAQVAGWMLDNMFDERGYFYYQKLKYYTHGTSYMRWSNIWMFAALNYYLYKRHKENEN